MINIPKMLRNSSNGEVNATVNALRTRLKTNQVENDAHLADIISTLDENYDLLNEAIKRSKIKSELEEKDKVRDLALVALFNLVKGYLNVDNDTRNHALKLQEILDKYGLSKITKANYANESAYINSLILDLKAPAIYSEHIFTPFVVETLDKLILAQKNFETAYNNYTTTLAIQNSKENATQIKMKLLEIINMNLVDYLKIMSNVNGGKYETMAIDTAAIITDNNERVNRRRNKKSDPNTTA